jgi:hypothetical protein
MRHSLGFDKNINAGTGSNFIDYLSASYSFSWAFSAASAVSFTASYQQSQTSAAGGLILPVNSFLNPGTGQSDLAYAPPGSEFITATGPKGVVVDTGIFVPIPGQTSDTIQAGLGLSHRFGRHLGGSLGYSHVIGDSSAFRGSYAQNTVTASLNYRF